MSPPAPRANTSNQRSPTVPPLNNANRPQRNGQRRFRQKRVQKPVKRLDEKSGQPHFNIRQSPRRTNPNQRTDYHSDLADFIALRKSDPTNPVKIAAVPSDELMWIRDGSEPQQLSSLPATSTSSNVINVDDEIEEGEIVESEVNGIVNLLEESFAAVARSQSHFVDYRTPVKNELPFFEDRGTSNYGKIPHYSTFGKESDKSIDIRNSSSDDVVCLESSQSTADDSVIFVSEEKQQNKRTPKASKAPKLPIPDFLRSPNIRTEARKLNRKQRISAWKEKKTKEFAAKAASTNELKPSTSSTSVTSSSSVASQPDANAQIQGGKVPQLEKRIIIIDGSNLAMTYTDNYGRRKVDKDFSAEGKTSSIRFVSLLSLCLPTGLKIGIDHFEKMGFPVKAVVPEFRCRRDKSSNHAVMTEMKDQGKLVCTPSKSYDDRVILEAAVKLDAAVVSNDHFRQEHKIPFSLLYLTFSLTGDLLNERPEFRDVVNQRLIRFNWLFKQLIIPEDPHGQSGPKLNDILYKTT